MTRHRDFIFRAAPAALKIVGILFLLAVMVALAIIVGIMWISHDQVPG